MKKEDLVAKGLSEEHAQIVVDAWNEAMKGFIPKAGFDEVNEGMKQLNWQRKGCMTNGISFLSGPDAPSGSPTKNTDEDQQCEQDLYIN